MKILVLNPQFDAEHGFLQDLQKKGVATLVPADAQEAWQMLQLHGGNLDLAWIHREPAGEDLVARIRKDPAFSDLPVVLTSSQWRDPDFAKHQDGMFGANAYLSMPAESAKMIELIEAVLGVPLSGASAIGEPPPGPVDDGVVISSEPSQHLEISIESDLPSVEADLTPELSIESKPVEHIQSILENKEFENSGEEVSLVQSKTPSFSDREISDEMPYLFGERQTEMSRPLMGAPVGDAVVPGGAAESPDLETLKKYLQLREQDVVALSAQLRSAREHSDSLDRILRQEREHSSGLEITVADQKKRIENFEAENEQRLASLQIEVEELRFQLKIKQDKLKILEKQCQEANTELSRIKDRVKQDIRKIRSREKELENRLEILKKDSESLISLRENRIIELKRKVDTLEFNFELIKEQYEKEKAMNSDIRHKLIRASRAMRVAEGMLDEEKAAEADDGKGVEDAS